MIRTHTRLARKVLLVAVVFISPGLVSTSAGFGVTRLIIDNNADTTAPAREVFTGMEGQWTSVSLEWRVLLTLDEVEGSFFLQVSEPGLSVTRAICRPDEGVLLRCLGDSYRGDGVYPYESKLLRDGQGMLVEDWRVHSGSEKVPDQHGEVRYLPSERGIGPSR